MAKISKVDIIDINNQCSNDWKLDLEFFAFFGEKSLRKRIKLDDNHFLECRLNYNSKKQIYLNISKYFHEENDNMASGSGGEITILDSKVHKRQEINKLIEYTKELTESKLLEQYKKNEKNKRNKTREYPF